MKITITVYREQEEILTRVLDEGEYRFGRSEFCDIVLDDKSVSRSHLELRVTENSVYMTNMSSNNRVTVNGKKLETSELVDGDEVRVGLFRIVVCHGEKLGMELAPSPEPVSENEEKPPQLAEVAPAAEEPGAEIAKTDEPPKPKEEDGAVEPQVDPLPLKPSSDELRPVAQPDLSVASEGSGLGQVETQVELKPIVAKLMFTEGPKAGQELFVETFEITLGRSKKADIFLDDERLSRIHAKITRVGMGYRLIDMNSRNGTYVNGMRILEHPLSSFDEIQIGSSKIKFLIHDIMASEAQRAQLAVVDQTGTLSPSAAAEQTKSLQVDALPQDVLLELQRPIAGGGGPPQTVGEAEGEEPIFTSPRRQRKSIWLVALLAFLAIIYFLMPSGPTDGDKSQPSAVGTKMEKKDDIAPIKLPPSLPKEYAELTPDQQRQIEGFYNASMQSANQEQYEDSIEYLKKIHALLPFYKNSRELFDSYMKKSKEKQIAEAQKRAKEDAKQDLAIYLEDGLQYLKSGDFEKAAEAFNSAIVIDPQNETAIKGLKAAEAKVTDINAVPEEVDPEAEKRKQVADLFQKAVISFTNKAYQDAINTAEKIQQIEIKGDAQYLSEAKQIIDRARMLQKEEFEPFLIQAKEKYAEADYMASREMCEEMEKRDPSYEDAKECAAKARKQLNRLAKEAYQYGYILESMNRIEEAKQYWNRAKNFVRKGDPHYDKIIKKLEYYQ